MQTGTIPPQLRCDKGAVPLSHSMRAPALSGGIRLASVYLRGLRAPVWISITLNGGIARARLRTRSGTSPRRVTCRATKDETGNDAVEMDAASDPVEPLTFEQAWAQAEADEAKADATATLGEPADMSISPAKTRNRATPSTPAVRHLSAFSTCPRKAPRRLRPRIAPTWLVRKTRAAVLRSAPSSSPSWPALSPARQSAASGVMSSGSAKTPPRSRCRRAIAQPHALGACVGRG